MSTADESRTTPGPTPVTNPPEVVLKPLPEEDWPSIDHIITEDGAPVDNVFSEKQMRLLTEPLYSSWQPGHPFVALANVGVFYGVDLPPLVPDALLSLHVRMPENLFPKINRSYFVWKYGKPPEVVVEVVSNKKGGEDTHKLQRYADMRVSHYVIFDPEHYLSDDDIRWFTLHSSVLRPAPLATDPGRPAVAMPEVGLGLSLWTGLYESTDAMWLRWTDLDGKLVPTGRENAAEAQTRAQAESERARSESERAQAASERAQAESERAQAESERAQAESERAQAESERADQAVAERDRLRDLLRRNGIDPDA
ncbi:MAG: cell envelope integrity protein TolA [Planctomycetota bacterium]